MTFDVVPLWVQMTREIAEALEKVFKHLGAELSDDYTMEDHSVPNKLVMIKVFYRGHHVATVDAYLIPEEDKYVIRTAYLKSLNLSGEENVST